MTQPGHQPSKDWLAFVRTSRARNKIKHVINASERLKAIEIGEKYLEKEARRLGVQLARVARADLDKVAGGYGYSKTEDLYAALGYGRFSARQVLSKVAPDKGAKEPAETSPAPEVEPAGGAPAGPGEPARAAGFFVYEKMECSRYIVCRERKRFFRTNLQQNNYSFIFFFAFCGSVFYGSERAKYLSN